MGKVVLHMHQVFTVAKVFNYFGEERKFLNISLWKGDYVLCLRYLIWGIFAEGEILYES